MLLAGFGSCATVGPPATAEKYLFYCTFGSFVLPLQRNAIELKVSRQLAAEQLIYFTNNVSQLKIILLVQKTLIILFEHTWSDIIFTQWCLLWVTNNFWISVLCKGLMRHPKRLCRNVWNDMDAFVAHHALYYPLITLWVFTSCPEHCLILFTWKWC